jgi:hypothetical protein
MSGISGYSNLNRYDASLDASAPAEEEAPAPAPEAQIVRGGAPAVPSIGSQMADVVSDLTATELAKKLQTDGGLTKTEAKAEAKEIKKTAEEIQKLEEKLSGLETKRAELQKRVDDPSLDWWDKMWAEWDLADVDYEIAGVKQELGQLTDTLEDIVGSFNGALDKLFASAMTGLDFYTTLNRIFSSQLTEKIDADAARRQIDVADRKKGEAAADLRTKERAHLQDIGTIRPSPPQSEAVKKELNRLRDDLEKGKFPRTEDGATKLRGRFAEVRNRRI